MSLSKKQREQLLRKHCGVINDDDAIDPRHYFYNKRKHDPKHRKIFQLCRQVSDTLHMVLGDGDPLLAELSVVDVVPAPDSRRLLVILRLDSSLDKVTGSEIESIMQRLQSQTPRLRSEIARTISRRKTPNLVFEIAKFGS